MRGSAQQQPLKHERHGLAQTRGAVRGDQNRLERVFTSLRDGAETFVMVASLYAVELAHVNATPTDKRPMITARAIFAFDDASECS